MVTIEEKRSFTMSGERPSKRVVLVKFFGIVIFKRTAEAVTFPQQP